MKRLRLGLSAVLIALAMVGFMPASASGSVIQSRSCSSCTSLAYTSNITGGNLLVIVITDAQATKMDFVVTDSLGNNVIQAVVKSYSPGPYCSGTQCNAAVYFATAVSSGADTISGGFTTSGGGSITIFEVSGTSKTVADTETGQYVCSFIIGTCTAQTSASTSFSSYGFLVGGFVGSVCTNTAAESGYSRIQTSVTNGAESEAIYSVAGVSSPTFYGISISCTGAQEAGGPMVGVAFGLPSGASQSTTTTTTTATSTVTSTTSVACTSTVSTTTTVTTTLTITTTINALTYTVTTNPPGLASSIQVDGQVYNSPQTFHWAPGSTHIIAALSPCNLQNSPYTSYTFVSWSDAGNQAHSVVAPSSSTVYTANFQTTAVSVSCGAPNPLQQLERGCVVPALVLAWSASIGLQPWLGFVLLGINVAVYNKTQSIWLTLTVLWVMGATFSFFLPPYLGIVAQLFLYLGAAGLVVKGILFVR